MIRKVFFSFRFQDDIFRVNQVRNMGQFETVNNFNDHAEYEKLKHQTDGVIKKWIDKQLHGASVTCVLIGTKTHTSKWVDYEIRKSIELGKGVFGIYIHNLKDQNGSYSQKGKNPIDKPYIRFITNRSFNTTTEEFFFTQNELQAYEPTHNSYITAYQSIKRNLVHWIENAAKQAGR